VSIVPRSSSNVIGQLIEVNNECRGIHKFFEFASIKSGRAKMRGGA
jgi:hypothetical protein